MLYVPLPPRLYPRQSAPTWSSMAPSPGIAKSMRPCRSSPMAGPARCRAVRAGGPPQHRGPDQPAFRASPRRESRLLRHRPGGPGPRRDASLLPRRIRTPLDYQSAAEILTRLIESDAIGIVHVGGRERLSRYELMRRVAIARGIDTDLIIPSCQADASFLEPRPADVSLDTTRLASLCPDLDRPDLDMALAAM